MAGLCHYKDTHVGKHYNGRRPQITVRSRYLPGVLYVPMLILEYDMLESAAMGGCCAENECSAVLALSLCLDVFECHETVVRTELEDARALSICGMRFGSCTLGGLADVRHGWRDHR